MEEQVNSAVGDSVQISALSFEQALQELEVIVRRLEQGNVALEESITIYERGVALRNHCDGLLKKVEMRAEQIQLDKENQPIGLDQLK